jgi:site-specific recombinase XerD
MFSRGVCLACYNFTGRHKDTAGDCSACGSRQPLKRGYCRLCWVQAAIARPTGPGTPLAPYLGSVRHQQLFLADLNRRQAAPRRFPRRYGEKGRPRKPPPPVVTRPIEWPQLQLFDARRDYRYGRVDLRRGEPPENPWLDWALHLAHTIAEARGFDAIVRRALNRNLIMLLAEHRDGELIRRSDFHHVVSKRGASIKHTSEVLQQMGVLLDDRAPTFEAWLERKLDGLTPGIRQVTEAWVRALHDGGPRSRPRSPHTAATYLRFALPALLDWSARYAHLRQVTREDLLAHTGPLRGQRRETTLVALRSLFAWAKKNGAIFRDPAARIKVGRLEHPVWQPLRQEEIDATIAAASTPQARLTVCLAAVHAARHGTIRALTLDDVDLPNRCLTIAERERPLDGLTHRLLRQWLDYRQQRWPNTANQHLLISANSALGHGPVSAVWVSRALRGLTATIERLRIDRQLEEALVSGADPLHLTVVFDIDETTAIRYATSARQLLQETHAARPPDSPRTQVSSPDNPAAEHLGSH